AFCVQRTATPGVLDEEYLCPAFHRFHRRERSYPQHRGYGTADADDASIPRRSALCTGDEKRLVRREGRWPWHEGGWTRPGTEGRRVARPLSSSARRIQTLLSSMSAIRGTDESSPCPPASMKNRRVRLVVCQRSALSTVGNLMATSLHRSIQSLDSAESAIAVVAVSNLCR